MKIDLDQVVDDLGGDWWHYISSENFGFVVNIPDINTLEVEKDDILIHKEKQTGERFTTIRYRIVTDKGSEEAKKKDVNEVLAKKLAYSYKLR